MKSQKQTQGQDVVVSQNRVRLMEAEARWLNAVTRRVGLIQDVLERHAHLLGAEATGLLVRTMVGLLAGSPEPVRSRDPDLHLREKVLAALKRAGGSATARTVARSVSAKGGTVRRVLEELVAAGVLSAVVSKPRGRGRPTVKYFFRGDGVGQGRS